MNINAIEEEVLQANDDSYESEDTDTTSDEVPQESSSEEIETDTTEDTISVSRTEYDKLRRESAAAKRLREKVGKKDSGEGERGGHTLDQELINRTYLAAQAGIKDKEVQDEALRLAEKFGMSIAEAVDDADIATRIATLQKRKETQRAIAKSTGGSTSRSKDVSYYASYFKQHGDFPADTPNNMIVKVMQDYS